MEARGADPLDPADADAAAAEPLTGTLVRYADRPDRMTIHPEEDDDVALMARWLSADADAFVHLEAFR
jgi:hypothetical protein